MGWLRILGNGRRRSPFNNLDKKGCLTCGRVTDQLYVGGELGPRDWDALQKEGVSVVINLQHEQQDVFAPSERIDGYLWIPAPDGQAPSLEQLEQGVLLIRAAVRRGRKVFVHCKAGQGRAPLLCACYLITEGETPLKAIERVRMARGRTLLTPEQSLRLREFGAAYGSNAPNPQTETSETTDTAAESTEADTTETIEKPLAEISDLPQTNGAHGTAAPAPAVVPNGNSPSVSHKHQKKPIRGSSGT